MLKNNGFEEFPFERLSRERSFKDHKHLRRLEFELEAPARKKQSKFLGVIMGLKNKNEIKKLILEKPKEENPRSPKGAIIEVLIQES